VLCKRVLYIHGKGGIEMKIKIILCEDDDSEKGYTSSIISTNTVAISVYFDLCKRLLLRAPDTKGEPK